METKEEEIRAIPYRETSEFEIELNQMLRDGYRLMPESLREGIRYIFLIREVKNV